MKKIFIIKPQYGLSGREIEAKNITEARKIAVSEFGPTAIVGRKSNDHVLPRGKREITATSKFRSPV